MRSLSIRTIIPLIVLFLTLYCRTLAAVEAVVVVNKTNLHAELSLKELRDIFSLKKRQWDNGEPIQLFVLANDHPVHQAFCKKKLGVFARQLEAIWYRKIYTGTGQAPMIFDNEKTMLEEIASSPGAIGYVDNGFLNSYEKTHADTENKTRTVPIN